jgi:hypothetical protein
MDPKLLTIKYDDLSAAFDFVSFAAPFEHNAFVSLDTGAIYWVTETGAVDDQGLPDDLETSDRYIPIPHKNDLDLGKRLALRFAEERLTHRYANVEACFRYRGAYGRFKELLEEEGSLEEWYAFEAESTERALREWCAANGIELVADAPEQSA